MEGMVRSSIEDRKVVVRPPQTGSSRSKGLRRSRGRADVKYQCQGDVPQAEAPMPSSFDGRTLERNAASSGQSSLLDCQKNVSMLTVRRRPATVAERMAGRKTARTREMALLKVPAFRRR